MSNYVIGTYLSGEKLTNLLVNSVIREINKETKNHKTNIQVVHQGNFIVVRGTTTHKSPINLLIEIAPLEKIFRISFSSFYLSEIL